MAIKGPKLQDIDFFNKVVNTTIPGLEEIQVAAHKGDFRIARKIFADYIRKALKVENFFKIPYEPGENDFTYPGESEAAAAERIIRLELISTGTPHQFQGKVDWYTNPTFNKYKEWTWQLSRHHEWKLLARRYVETGDERFAKTFVEFFQSWVEQALVPETAPSGDTLCWRTIEAGIRMGSVWPYTLHAFYKSPYFTDDILVDWYKSVWEHGERLRNFHRTGNWLVMEMNGLAHIGILYPEFKTSQKWKDYAFQNLIKELEIQIHPDGFQYELSTNYHQVVINNYNRIAYTCKAYGEKIHAKFSEKLERLYELYIKLVMPDGRLPDLNDGKWAKIAGWMKTAVEMFPYREDFLWFATEGQQGKCPSYTSQFLPYSGIAVMRNGWENDNIWALLDAGPFGRGHQHEDKLNLLLAAYGKLLLTEGGNYAYDNSEMRRYVLSTRSHNTVLVDSMNQNRRANYQWKDEDIFKLSDAKWYSSTEYDTVEGVYEEGYGPEAKQEVKHCRKIIFIKNPKGDVNPFFMVIDRFYPISENPHTYELMWHFEDGPVQVDGLKVTSGNKDEPSLILIPSQAEALTVNIIKGQEDPEWQGWEPYGRRNQGEYAAAPVAIYSAKAAGALRITTLLYPSRDGECPIERIEAGTEASDHIINVYLRDGNMIKLNESDFFTRES